MDIFSNEKRSWIMRSIKSKNTGPEKAVEALLRSAHIRYRTQTRGLPGTPDFLLPDFQVAIFVHGCFWHGHDNCSRAGLPSTRRQFWLSKIEANKKRDRAAAGKLRRAGFAVLTVWTCRRNRLGLLLEQLARRKIPMTLGTAARASRQLSSKRIPTRRRRGRVR